MPDISREQIEQKIRQLIEEEQASLDEISFDDLISAAASSEVDLKSFFVELGSLKTEMKQLNRSENKRVEALRDFLESEKRSKEQIVAQITEITRQHELLGFKSLVQSIIELRDFVETFARALPKVFNDGAPPLPLWSWRQRELESHGYMARNIDSILKKIDALLEKQDVFPIETDNEKFDPAFMTAVESANNSAKGDNQVIETILKGYVFNNVVIRYAKVKVNKKPKGDEG